MNITKIITLTLFALGINLTTFAQEQTKNQVESKYLDSARLPKSAKLNKYEQQQAELPIKYLFAKYNKDKTEQGYKKIINEYNSLYDVLNQVFVFGKSQVNPISKRYEFLIDARNPQKFHHPDYISSYATSLLENGYTLERIQSLFETEKINLLREIEESSNLGKMAFFASDIVIGVIDSLYEDLNLYDGLPNSYSVTVQEVIKGDKSLKKVILRNSKFSIFTFPNGHKHITPNSDHSRPRLQNGQAYLLFLSKPGYESHILKMSYQGQDSLIVTTSGKKAPFSNDNAMQPLRQNCYISTFEIPFNQTLDAEDQKYPDLIEMVNRDKQSIEQVRAICKKYQRFFEQIRSSGFGSQE